MTFSLPDAESKLEGSEVGDGNSKRDETVEDNERRCGEGSRKRRFQV